MIIRAALIASMLLFSASAAMAQITLTASTSTVSGNPVSALVDGDVVTIDVLLRNDGTEIFGLGFAAENYDPAIASFTSGTSVSDVLVQACLPSFGCLNGLTNAVAGALSENSGSVLFMNGILAATTGIAFTGENDEGVDGNAGTAQFQLVFTVANAGETTLATTIDLGTNGGSNVVVLDMGVTADATTSVTLTVPEPAAALSSLAALGAVFTVVGVRRRF